MKTPKKQTSENFIKEIRRNTRRIFSSEQKIQIVMEALDEAIDENNSAINQHFNH